MAGMLPLGPAAAAAAAVLGARLALASAAEGGSPAHIVPFDLSASVQLGEIVRRLREVIRLHGVPARAGGCDDGNDRGHHRERHPGP